MTDLLCADWATMDLCAKALAQRKLPHRVRKRSGDYQPGADAVQVMTMKVSKGLEFPVMALPGVGHLAAPGGDQKEAARVFYVANYAEVTRLGRWHRLISRESYLSVQFHVKELAFT